MNAYRKLGVISAASFLLVFAVVQTSMLAGIASVVVLVVVLTTPGGLTPVSPYGTIVGTESERDSLQEKP